MAKNWLEIAATIVVLTMTTGLVGLFVTAFSLWANLFLLPIIATFAFAAIVSIWEV